LIGRRRLRYNDRDLTPDGLRSIVLKEGLAAGKAKIVAQGKGDLLGTPDLAALARR
jgi:hypothetical protein